MFRPGRVNLGIRIVWEYVGDSKRPSGTSRRLTAALCSQQTTYFEVALWVMAKIEPPGCVHRLDDTMLGREVWVRGQVAGSDGAGSARAAAFSQLTDRHLSSFYRLAAVLLGSEPEAQDAVQDAAVIAWERFASLRNPERFEAWFQRILVNQCRDRLRRRRRVRIVPLDDQLGADTLARDATSADRDALRRALDSLTADQRLVVVLRYSADLSLVEIADRTGQRLGTVKSRLHYALKALHAAYDADGRSSGRSTL